MGLRAAKGEHVEGGKILALNYLSTTAVQCTEYCSICKIEIIHQSRTTSLLFLQNI